MPKTRDLSRAHHLAGTIHARGRRLAERAQAERGRHSSVDAAFEMVDRDVELGGGIIAGALAYRLFIWLLPMALVVVAGLGIAADAASRSPRAAADELGLKGLVNNSVASAAEGQGRTYALLIGIPVLLYLTRSLLSTLIVAHRLLWVDVRAASPKPTVMATIMLLGSILGFLVVSALAGAVRARWTEVGVLATALEVLPYAGLWLIVSTHLPHRGADWRALVPGALVMAVGVEVLHVVSAYVLVPYALNKQGTYGALGVAAALLLSLFLISRLIVATAVVNATLWERQAQAEPSAGPTG